MSRQLLDLEAVLQQLIVEHQKLTRHLNDHQLAMRRMDLKAMDQHANFQEAVRLRIGALESKRRFAVQQLVRLHRLAGEPTIRQIADLYPQRAAGLLKLRDELRATIQQAGERAFVGGKLASAVLGHLNTVVRLVAGAVEKAGVYTKHGVPRMAPRIGVMEAVG